MEKAKKEMNMEKAKKGKSKPDSPNNLGKVALGMMSCAASAALEDIETGEKTSEMKNTLANHFTRDFFCSEKYHRAWLKALRKTVKEFAKNDKSEGGSRTRIELNSIYDRREKELINWSCKGIMQFGTVRRWLKELRDLFRELNIELT